MSKFLDGTGLADLCNNIKTYITNQLASYAPKNSPALTGTPTSTTPTANDNSTKIATTAFVQTAVSGAAPTTIPDEEIEEYWSGVDPEAFSEFLPLTGGTLTGNLTLSDGGNPLSTAGGTMSGAVKWNGTAAVNKFYVGFTEGDGSYDVGWANTSYGAKIALRSANYTRDGDGSVGEFIIIANNGTVTKTLRGAAGGALEWNGKKITVNANTTTVTAVANPGAISSTGTYHHLYRCGPIVVLGLNINVIASVASGTALFTGLPKPPAKVAGGIIAAGTTLRVYIDTDGSLKLDGASPSTATWFDGCITYITTD